MAEQSIHVHDLSQDGRGVGRLPSGKTCFISGALPGETVHVKTLKSKRSYDEAVCTRVLEASPDRETPRCEYFNECGGCELQHLISIAQLDWKQRQLKALCSKMGLEVCQWMPPLHVSDWNYRRRTRLAVAYNKKGLAFMGYRARGSRQVVDINHCNVLDKRLEPLIPGLKSLLPKLKDRGLNEIELSAGDDQLAICFSLKSSLFGEHLQAIGEYFPGIAIWQKLSGQEPAVMFKTRVLRAQLGNDVEMEFRPGQFVQINNALNLAMIKQSWEWLNPQKTQSMLDLFCGAGNFSLAFAPQVKSVLGVEGSHSLCQQAQKNADLNNLANLEFRALDLFAPENFSQIGKGSFELALLDPPRAGAIELMPWLAKLGPEKILYISCHPATMVRDIQQLVGKYRIEKVGAMNMFPHTTHLEAMVLLVRE